MVLRFLAVKAPGGIALMMISQCNAGRCCQRDTLVGRAKQDIKFSIARHYCLCITATQPGQMFTGIEQACIEKVGAGPAGFQCELAKA